MADVNYEKYNNKKPCNGLPVPEGQYLVPFYVHGWSEVRAENYCRDSLETWDINGFDILVAFKPVTKELFPFSMKLFWGDVRSHIADLIDEPREVPSSGGSAYASSKTEALEDTVIPVLAIRELIDEISRENPRHGIILKLLCLGYERNEIVGFLMSSYGIRKTQSYDDIKAALKKFKKLYSSD